MKEVKEDLRYYREQLEMEKETLATYDIMGMDKESRQYQQTLREIERINKKIAEVHKDEF